MNLPPELLDEIICNLASDVSSLRRCSLVAKSWVHPSRKWLFKDIFISKDAHRRCLGGILPEDVELLRGVRSFTYIFDRSAWFNWNTTPSQYRIDSLRHYLPSLHCLNDLGLIYIFLGPEVPQQIRLFSAFQHTLRSLSIGCCHTTPNALITLINYSPLLINLDLRRLTYEGDGGPALQLSRPLRGKLTVADCETKDQVLFKRLSDPPLELDELLLFRVNAPIFYEDVIGAHGGSVKRLKMSHCIRGQERTPSNSQIFPLLIRSINPHQGLFRPSLIAENSANYGFPSKPRYTTKYHSSHPLPQLISRRLSFQYGMNSRGRVT